jgi:RNA polymerase sigma-70 factor (ECF subfamily)
MRYRERGDVSALTAVFNETAPGLLALARHLVGRPEDAEDALQATFLTAIERADKYDPSLPLNPWLTGILVRKARRTSERGAQRIEPDRVDERVAPDPAVQASSAEFTDELKRALARLPERYRSVLQPFLHDGDRPQDIARQQGVPQGTARVRIHRGLKLLRESLPPSYAVGASAAVVSSSTLASIHARVVSAAKSAGSASAPAAATTGSVAVFSAVGPRSLIAAAAVIVAGAGAWQLARPASPNAQEPALDELAARGDAVLASPEEASEEDSQAPLESLASPATSDTERVAAQASSSERGEQGPAWTLFAEVAGLDGTAWDDMVLTVATTETPPRSLTVPIPGDGPLALPLADVLGATTESAPELVLEILHDVYAPLRYETSQADSPRTGELNVTLALERRFSVLTGRAVSASGAAATVAFFGTPEEDTSIGMYRTTAACASDGSFRLLTEHATGWFVAVAGECAPFGDRMQFVGFQDIDLGVVEIVRGASIAGIAHGPGGTPPGAGRFVADGVAAKDAPKGSVGDHDLAFLSQTVVSSGASVSIEPSGDFRVGALTPGTYDVLFVANVQASGYYDATEHGMRVEAPVAGLELESPIRVYTIEVVAEGRPLSDASVKYTLDGGSSVQGPTTPDGRYEFFMAHTDERHPVEVEKPGFAKRELNLGPADFDRDGTLQVELERTAPPAELTLLFEPSRGPLGRLGIRMSLADSTWYIYRPAAPSDGTLALGEVPAGRYQLEIWPEIDDTLEPARQGFWRKTEVELVCAPSSSERVTVALPPSGRTALHVDELDEAGAGSWVLNGPDGPGPLWLLSWDPLERKLRTLYTPASIEQPGEYWLSRALAPGEYQLDVYLDGDVRSHPFLIVDGETTDVFLNE